MSAWGAGIGAVLGGAGGVLSSLGSYKSSVTSLIKNPELQRYIDSSLGDFGSIRSAGEGALSDYITKYLATTKDSSKWGDQEMGAVGDFYNGNVAQRLSELRAQRSKAMQDAAGVASSQALRNVNMSRLGEGGSGSSYDARLAMANLTPIRVQAALDDSNQARADYGYVTGNQIDLAGRRLALANQYAGVGLVPEQMRRQFYGQNLGYLGTLGSLDQMNKFYGIKQTPDTMMTIGNALNAFVSGAASGAAAGSGMGSMMGGGGSGSGMGGMMGGGGTSTGTSQPQPPAVQWQSLNSGYGPLTQAGANQVMSPTFGSASNGYSPGGWSGLSIYGGMLPQSYNQNQYSTFGNYGY